MPAGSSAYTVTAPSPASAMAGELSANWTVSAIGAFLPVDGNGVAGGSVIVTPAATGVTFSPSSVSISGGGSATFQAKSANPGTYTVAFTNDRGYADVASVGFIGIPWTGWTATWGIGYQVNGSFPADGIVEPGDSNIASGGSGTASISVKWNFGQTRTLSKLTGVIGYGTALTEIWETSADGTTWSTLATTQNVTPPGNGGVYGAVTQSWSFASTSAQYWRYSAQDTAAGGGFAQVGVVTLGVGGAASNSLSVGTSGTINTNYSHSKVEYFTSIWRNGDPSTKTVVFAPTSDLDIPPDYNDPWWVYYGFSSSEISPAAYGAFIQQPNLVNGNYPGNYQALGYFSHIVSTPNPQPGLFTRSGTNPSWTYTLHSSMEGKSFLHWVTQVTSVYTRAGSVGSYYYNVVSTTDYYVGQVSPAAQAVPQYKLGDPALTIGQFGVHDIAGAFGVSARSANTRQYGTINLPDVFVYKTTESDWSITDLQSFLGISTSDSAGRGFFSLSATNITTSTVDIAGILNNPLTSRDLGLFIADTRKDDGKAVFKDNSGNPTPRFAIFQVIVNGGGGGGGNTNSGADVARLSVDWRDGILNVAWVNGSGALKTSVHLAPTAYIGSGASGWQAPQTVESANSTSCGIAYLANETLYLACNLSGNAKWRHSEQKGLSGSWSSTLPEAVGLGQFASKTRGQEMVFRASAGANSSGAIFLYTCSDNTGTDWVNRATIVSGARGPLCGLVFTGHSWGCLYTKFSDSKVLFLRTSNVGLWTASPIDTGVTGRATSIARLRSGRIVGLVQDLNTSAVKPIWSNDRGATWSAGSAIGITPDPPPVIVSAGDLLYLVYIVSDAPVFQCSQDGGATWS